MQIKSVKIPDLEPKTPVKSGKLPDLALTKYIAIMEIYPIAIFKSPLSGKFGVPRQSGLAQSLEGEIQLQAPFNRPEALRGLDGFNYIWLIWEFSLNPQNKGLTVRPPRLGGNERVGVFASRSPFRPNGLGLSCVELVDIDFSKGCIHVKGADLADGTPIYDIKPYVSYTDSHPDAEGGFVDTSEWKPLKVVFDADCPTPDRLTGIELEALKEILSLDPRPQYQDDPSREYGLSFSGFNVRFRVDGETLTVISVE